MTSSELTVARSTVAVTAAGAPPDPGHRPWDLRVNGWLGLLLAAPMIVMLGLFVVYPLIRVFVEASSDGEPTSRYLDVFLNPISRNALVTTLLDSLIVTGVTVTSALAIAWTLHATTSRFVRVALWTVALIPMWMGVIMKNYSIFIMLSANGPVNSFLMLTGVSSAPIPLLYNNTAVVVGISYSLIPYAVFSLYATISRVDKTLLAAAEALGATRVTALRTIALPMSRDGIGASMALVFVLSIGFYVTPILLGGPQTPFMATRISQQINSSYDYPGAAASAAVLLVIAVIVVGAALAMVGGRGLRGILR